MATKPRKTRKSYEVVRSAELPPIENIDLDTFTENCLKFYGEEVNLDRSVPDYRDGLKPVTRRALWALHTMGNQTVKTARLSGETMGKYHPHSSASIDGAIHTQVVAPCPPITGIGNWGSIIDPPGASRYTNVKMSPYGKSFFGKDYTPLMSSIDSYDGKEKEPLFLPATLPNLLLNGVEGIGLGLATSLPAFTPTSLLPILADIAEGEKLTDLDIAKRLVPYNLYGGELVKSKENFERLKSFVSSSNGSLQWTSPMEVDDTAKTITLTKFGPGVNPIKLVEGFLKPMREIASVHSGAGVSYVVQARKDLNGNDFKSLVEKIRKKVTTNSSYEIYVTRRDVKKDDPSKYDVRFRKVTLRELMMYWLRYRIDLEKSSLENQIKVSESRIRHFSLLILACAHLDVIFKALRSKDPRSILVREMKISEEDADTILNLKVRQLSKLDNEEIQVQKQKEEQHRKELRTLLKTPHLQVATFLRDTADHFKFVQNDWSNQWIL